MAAVVLVATASTMAADVFVGPPPFNPGPGQQVAFHLVVDVGPDALGSYFFVFQYDPAVVHLTAVQAGTTAEFSSAPVTDPSTFGSGSTPLAGAQGSLTSPRGFVSVARLTLLAVGSAGESSNLDAQVNTLIDTQLNALPATVFPSSVLINVSEVAADLAFLDSQTMTWSASNGVTSYNVYRGTFAGHPWNFDHTCLSAGLLSPIVVDLDAPPPGGGFYYLLSGVQNMVEGTLGVASTGAPRPNASPCVGTLLRVTEVHAGVPAPQAQRDHGSPTAEQRRKAVRMWTGDVEGDGFIDDLDVQRVLEAVVGTRVLTPRQRADADVDGDGDVDVVDAQRIRQYLAGSLPELTRWPVRHMLDGGEALLPDGEEK